MLATNTVEHVRFELSRRLRLGHFTGVSRERSMTDLMGSQTIEMVGASFIADQETIFGTLNLDYVKREEAWYDSQSLCVDDIPGGAPAVWRAVAKPDDMTFVSNYGWAVHSPANGGQFDKVVNELKRNPESRRAVIIYTRPSMWEEHCDGGRNDFCCTNAVQYLVRDEQVHCIVQMRSNDCVYGYKGDRHWQATVLGRVAKELGLASGKIHWQVGSLHLYARHFFLVDHYHRTGETTITRERYGELYPNSPYLNAGPEKEQKS